MTATKTAIRSLLGADALYKTLIGVSTEPWRTFWLVPPQPPTFPYVVFKIRPMRTSVEIGDPIISQNGDLAFVVWGQAQDNIEGIADRIKKVLHQRYDSQGNHFVLSGEPEELYDEETNAYGIRLTFNLITRGVI